MTTIVIVDDHPASRTEARRLLEQDGFTVIGEAADGRSALELLRRLVPQAILLDIGLPDTDGFAVARDLRAAGCAASIILTSTRDQDTYGDRIRDALAIGFIAKAELSGPGIRALLDAA